MIKTLEQAARIQMKRVKRGQFGHSKAVRRFLKRGLQIGDIHNKPLKLSKLDDYNKYLEGKDFLPHLTKDEAIALKQD